MSRDSKHKDLIGTSMFEDTHNRRYTKNIKKFKNKINCVTGILKF